MINPEPRDSDASVLSLLISVFSSAEKLEIFTTLGISFSAKSAKEGYCAEALLAGQTTLNTKPIKKNFSFIICTYLALTSEVPKYLKNSESGANTKDALPSAKEFL